MSTLSYAGINLPLNTYEMATILAERYNLRDLRINTHGRTWPGPDLIGVAAPFRDPQWTLSIGQFFYPSGATRWSEFHTLVDETSYNAIAALAFPSTPRPFIIQNDNNGAVVTPMYALPGRVISDNADGLAWYLLSLVDERYYWQWRQTSFASSGGGSGTTWNDFFTTFATDLGITLTHDTIESAYLMPDPDSMLNAVSTGNAATMLEACLWNCGFVLVRNLDGSYHASNNATATNTQEANVTAAGVEYSGGDMFGGPTIPQLNSILPAQVQVTFPKWNCDTQEFAGPPIEMRNYTFNCSDYHVETVDLDSFTLGGETYSGVSDTIKLYHDTAKAVYDMKGGTLQNGPALEALAQQLAHDFYNWQYTGLDQVWPGIIPWVPEGNDDILWTLREGTCQTRVQRKPFNFGVEEMCHGYTPVCSGGGGSSHTTGCGTIKTNMQTIMGLNNDDTDDGYYPDYDLGGFSYNVFQLAGNTTFTGFAAPTDGCAHVVTLQLSGDTASTGFLLGIAENSSTSLPQNRVITPGGLGMQIPYGNGALQLIYDPDAQVWRGQYETPELIEYSTGVFASITLDTADTWTGTGGIVIPSTGVWLVWASATAEITSTLKDGLQPLVSMRLYDTVNDFQVSPDTPFVAGLQGLEQLGDLIDCILDRLHALDGGTCDAEVPHSFAYVLSSAATLFCVAQYTSDLMFPATIALQGFIDNADTDNHATLSWGQVMAIKII